MFDLKGLLLFEQEQSYTDFVKAAQRKLISLGYDLGPRKDDGIIGTLTRKALSDFQLKNGGNGKGNLGPFTAKKLGIAYVDRGQSDDTGPVPDSRSKNKGPVPDSGSKNTPKQNCGKFDIFPSVFETLSKICAGEKTDIQKGPGGCSE
jgi:peptidoglycan hydrolase-like protein with peptidoglycan-binding domain